MLKQRADRIPVYFYTGFMDSGKTSFIKETLSENDFDENARVLLIECENGEEEYDEIDLKKNHNANLVKIEKETDFTRENLIHMDKKFIPDLILIEYNGTWKFDVLRKEEILPSNWQIALILSAVDSTTFDLYVKNMRSIIFEQLAFSDIIVFNRCNENTPKAKFRQNIKSINRKVQILFESVDGEIEQGMDETVPFDINTNFINVPEADYGLWFLDLHDHPDRYIGKKVEFLALLYNGEGTTDDFFMAGRFAMTCCAEDIQFLAIKCMHNNSFDIINQSWAKITAEIHFEYDADFDEELPVLYIISITPDSEPDDHLVYFT